MVPHATQSPSHPSPVAPGPPERSGPAAARPVVIFVGGAGDRALRKVGRVVDRVRAMPDARTRRLRNLHHDQARSILALIGTLAPATPVRLVGHSWGGHACARIAAELGARGRPVDLLITVDPVSRRLGPGFLDRVKAGARLWVNARAAGGERTHYSDLVAAIGGPYGSAPRGHADIHLDLPHPHSAFDRMIECRLPDGPSLLDLALGTGAPAA